MKIENLTNYDNKYLFFLIPCSQVERHSYLFEKPKVIRTFFYFKVLVQA